MVSFQSSGSELGSRQRHQLLERSPEPTALQPPSLGLQADGLAIGGSVGWVMVGFKRFRDLKRGLEENGFLDGGGSGEWGGVGEH